MMHKNGSSLAADKAKGLLPRGSHSSEPWRSLESFCRFEVLLRCFGDFPPDLLPERLRPA